MWADNAIVCNDRLELSFYPNPDSWGCICIIYGLWTWQLVLIALDCDWFSEIMISCGSFTANPICFFSNICIRWRLRLHLTSLNSWNLGCFFLNCVLPVQFLLRFERKTANTFAETPSWRNNHVLIFKNFAKIFFGHKFSLKVWKWKKYASKTQIAPSPKENYVF